MYYAVICGMFIYRILFYFLLVSYMKTISLIALVFLSIGLPLSAFFPMLYTQECDGSVHINSFKIRVYNHSPVETEKDYIYNISHIRDMGSRLPLQYEKNLSIHNDFSFDSYSPPKLGFFNHNSLVDLFVTKTNVRYLGSNYSFGVYVYLDFFERNIKTVNTTNYDILILGAKGTSYNAPGYVEDGESTIRGYFMERDDESFSQLGIEVKDVNGDTFDDVILLSFNSSIRHEHFHRYAPGDARQAYYNIYSNGSLSIIYGKDYPSRTIIFCDLNITGNHPDVTLTNVPETINLYNLKVNDVNFDGNEDLIYISKEVTKIYFDSQNLTHIKGKINTYIILDMSTLNGISDFLSNVDVTLLWQPEDYYDYYTSFVEKPCKLFPVHLDSNPEPDLTFYDETLLPQIIGIYNFDFTSGVYNVSLLRDFSFSYPPPAHLYNWVYDFNVFQWNNDNLDDFIDEKLALITPPSGFMGNYVTPQTYNFSYGKSLKVEGPVSVYNPVTNSDIDDDGYNDAVFRVTSTTTYKHHFIVVKSSSESFTLSQNINVYDNISAFFINTDSIGISVSSAEGNYSNFIAATAINRDENRRIMIFANYRSPFYNVKLHFLSVTTPLNTPPQLTRMELPERIYRGRTSEMFLHVKDNYDNAYNMSVTVEYLSLIHI